MRSSSRSKECDLLGAQIDDRSLDFRLILHALKLDPGQVDLGKVAGFEAGPAYLDDLVIVLQVGLGQLQHRLGLEGLHKGRAQAEEQVGFEVNVSGTGKSACLPWRSASAAPSCARARAGS